QQSMWHRWHFGEEFRDDIPLRLFDLAVLIGVDHRKELLECYDRARCLTGVNSSQERKIGRKFLLADGSVFVLVVFLYQSLPVGNRVAKIFVRTPCSDEQGIPA